MRKMYGNWCWRSVPLDEIDVTIVDPLAVPEGVHGVRLIKQGEFSSLSEYTWLYPTMLNDVIYQRVKSG